jgi:hypothetical protein
MAMLGHSLNDLGIANGLARAQEPGNHREATLFFWKVLSEERSGQDGYCHQREAAPAMRYFHGMPPRAGTDTGPLHEEEYGRGRLPQCEEGYF